MSIRDANVVIIEVSKTVVRAGLGLHDLLKTPTVVRLLFFKLSSLTNFQQEIQARVGLRRNGFGENEISNGNSQLNGEFNGVEESFASTSRATSILPQSTKQNPSVNSYLVGSQLDEALASGQDISVFWPFADGEISDWTQAEAIWCPLSIYILTSESN